MKGKALADDFQVQDFVKKKKKKKRKHSQSNHNQENAEFVEDSELNYASPVLFEDRQEGEARKKKKKLKKKSDNQQALIDTFFVRVEHKTSNGTGAASPRKKMKRKGEDSTDELSDVTSVPVNQDCQEGAAAAAACFKKPKKKKKEKQPEEEELHELPPSEEHSKGHKEKSKKKKRKKRREGRVQEDTEGAAEQPLLSPSEQDRGHRGWPSPAGEDGGCDAASTISEELPARFSTPNKAPDRATKTPACAKKAIKSSTYVMEESSSESDVM